LQVSILAWRLLQNRLPIKDNLVVHDIISHENQLCVTGCGDIETAQHLFLSSPFWLLCRVLFGRGLPSHRRIHIIYKTILFNLFIHQDVCESSVLHCSLFGYVAFGFCGIKETIEFQEQGKLYSSLVR